MARIKTVKSYRGKDKCQHPDCGLSRKQHIEVRQDHTYDKGSLSCGGCMNPILPGQSYRFVVLKTGPRSSLRKNRHSGCAAFKPSELTTSPHKGALYAAEEDSEIALRQIEPTDDDAYSTLEQIAQDTADQVNQVAEALNESADNIEEGFGHETYQSEELRERAMEIEAWASDIECVVFDEAPTEDEIREDLDDPDLDDSELFDELSARCGEWLDNQIAQLSDVMSANPE